MRLRFNQTKHPFFKAAEYLIKHGSLTMSELKEKFCKDQNEKVDEKIYVSLTKSGLLVGSKSDSLDYYVLSPAGVRAYLANKALRQRWILSIIAIIVSICAIVISLFALSN